MANSSGASANNAGRSSFVGVDYGTSGDLEAVHSATGCVQTWRPENVPMAHPSLFVWGRGGPGEKRAINIGARAHAGLTTECADRVFAQNGLCVLERYDAVTRLAATSQLFSSLHRNNADVSASPFLTVTREELATATTYNDAVLAAMQAGKPRPPRPPNLSLVANQVLRTVKFAKTLVPGTLEHALVVRNKLFAMNRMFGNCHLWNTVSPNDTDTATVGSLASGVDGWHGGSAADLADAAVNDAPACAMYFDAVMNVLTEVLLGWDGPKQGSTAQGGAFGSIRAFAAIVEEQRRLTLHAHLQGFLDGLPTSTSALIDHLKDPANVRRLIARMQQATSTSHPVSNEEMETLTVVNHKCEYAGVHYSEAEDFVAQHLAVPDGYRQLTKPMPKLKPPLVLECPQCDDGRYTAREVALAWALQNAGEEAVTAYNDGNIRLDGVAIDYSLLFATDLSDDLKPEHARVKERAKVTLIGLSHLEHKVGHMKSCFKSKANKQKPRCRFRYPAVAFERSSVFINGEVVCDCVEGNVDSDCTHFKFTSEVEDDHEFGIDDVDTISLTVRRRQGFEYTCRHSRVELAVFRKCASFSDDLSLWIYRCGQLSHIFLD